MQYIIITSLSIVISAYLIYMLTNKLLNLRLNVKSLILCMCCALLINIILPRIIIGFVGVVGTVGILMLTTIVFAVSIAAAVPIPIIAGSSVRNAANKTDIESELKEKSVMLKEVYELKDENQNGELEENSEMVQVEDELQVPINGFDSSSKDLDGLIDSAFIYKEQHNFIQALEVFRQALILYPNTEAAPFLVMEIGSILKNNGQYNEAIHVFCEGRKLPGVQKDTMFDLEFIKIIAYLRIVKNILLQNRLGDISFKNIPGIVLKEIDSEFREWRNST